MLGRSYRWDDGVVIADLRIVHEFAAQRFFACARREMFAIRSGDVAHDFRQSRSHILRQMAAVGARIADQFMALIERLRQVQCFLRAESEQAGSRGAAVR